MASTITPVQAPVTPPEAPKTWMPVTAGILSIIAGVGDFFAGLIFGTVLGLAGAFEGLPWLGILAIPLIILGIVIVIGGIFALQRKVWGMALAKAICAILSATLLSILATVFVSLSKKEFK
jgi:hypothetical protein